MLSTRLTIIAFLAAALYGISHGQPKFDVACPGVNSELICSPGEKIEVTSMQHGVEKDADCKERANKATTVATENCLHGQMLGWVKLVCDELERCRLPKPNRRMFSCGYTADTFIQTTYECKKQLPGQQTIQTCEGETAEMKCEKGAIKVVKASFGRFDETTCMDDVDTPSIMTFCASYQADAKVKKECDGLPECSIEATIENLGRPSACDNNPYYLIVDYVCEE